MLFYTYVFVFFFFFFKQKPAYEMRISDWSSYVCSSDLLSNLDAKLRVQMRLEIKRLQRRLDTTSVYVTHDQVEAMTMADRLIVMNAGRAEQIDTPMAVYRHPASLFVAGFIGSPAMNFLAAEIAPDGAAAAPACGVRPGRKRGGEGKSGAARGE